MPADKPRMSAGTILVGIIVITFAVAAITWQLTGGKIARADAPLVLISSGILLLLIAVIGMVMSRPGKNSS